MFFLYILHIFPFLCTQVSKRKKAERAKKQTQQLILQKQAEMKERREKERKEREGVVEEVEYSIVENMGDMEGWGNEGAAHSTGTKPYTVEDIDSAWESDSDSTDSSDSSDSGSDSEH